MATEYSDQTYSVTLKDVTGLAWFLPFLQLLGARIVGQLRSSDDNGSTTRKPGMISMWVDFGYYATYLTFRNAVGSTGDPAGLLEQIGKVGS